MMSVRFLSAMALLTAVVQGAHADGMALTWNGSDGDMWNAATGNWLDGETPSAWMDGASATFGSAASIALNGPVAVSNLTTAGTLALSGPAPSTAFLSPNSATLVFPDITLDDIGGNDLVADISGKSVGSLYNEARAYHYTRNGTTATAQFQMVYNSHLRCVKVTFTESAGGVMAQVGSHSYYIHRDNGGASKLGVDVDADPYTQTWGIVMSTIGEGGIGICNLRGVRIPIHIAGSATLGGNVTLTNTAIELTAPLSQTWNRYLAGQNDCISAKGLSNATVDKTFGITDPNVGGESAAWLTSTENGTVFTNMVLSRTAIASAVLRGSYIGSDSAATPYFVTYDGEKLTCQLQTAGGDWVRGPIVELKQVGANVHARWVAAYFLQPGKLGDDMTKGAYYNRTQYGVKSLTLRTVDVPSVVFGGSSSPVTIAVDNAQVVLQNNLVYPSKTLVARNGAQVVLSSGGDANDRGSGKTYTFESGSVLLALVTGGTDGMAQYVFDNATLYAPLLHTGWKDGNTTVRYLTLKNGARTIGNPLRCGGDVTLEYISEGTGPNVLGTGVCIYRWTSTAPTKLNFTTSADLQVTGNIQDAPACEGTPIFKRGDATLSLSGTNTFAGQFTVEAGTVALGSNTALPQSAPITLKNCSVACGAGTANTTGALTLSGNVTIALGEGATLAFADSHSATWADGAILNITGMDELPTRALRFGTDDSGLTDSQLKKIRYNGSKVSLTAEGYLGGPKGMVILFN